MVARVAIVACVPSRELKITNAVLKGRSFTKVWHQDWS